jgi:hypothetical protein
MYTLVNFKLYNKASFIPGLNVYCDPLLKSLPSASHNEGREMVPNIVPVNEHEAQSTIVPIVGIKIRKEYELRQQCHFTLLVGVLRQRKEANFSRRQNVLLIVPSQYRY